MEEKKVKTSTLSATRAEPVIVTIQQHILSEQQKYSPDATGSFSWLLSGITLATKMTEARVRRAGLLDVLGSADGRVLLESYVASVEATVPA